MTFSRLFFWFCAFFLAGVFIASFVNLCFYFYFTIFILGLILFFVFYKREASAFGICILVFLFGVFWEDKFEAKIFPEDCVINSLESCDVHYFNGKSEVIFEGLILEEPKEKESSVQVIVSRQKILDSEKSIRGKILLTLPPSSLLEYGDKIQAKGEIKAPKNFTKEFDYKEYLRKDEIYSVMYEPEIKLLSRKNGNQFFEKIFSFKEKLKDTAKIVPPPQGAILSAITLGDKTRFSQNFKDKLARAGLSHITAISGMHIMILFAIFLYFFIWLGFWRSQATILTLIILILYIFMIGAPPSAIRAGIMGGLLYLGLASGRLNQSSRAITFAATGMVVVNPLILTRDVGFQLSFLASLGIIYLMPFFKDLLKTKGSRFKELISLTFSAQIFCLPILIYNFGQFSILAPISNLLVVPLLPVFLGVGFLYLIFGAIFLKGALVLSFVAEIPFLYVSKVVDFISAIPFSAVEFNIHPVSIFIFYICLFILIYKNSKKNYEK